VEVVMESMVVAVEHLWRLVVAVEHLWRLVVVVARW
jgi:hypothetical protein